MTRLTAFVTPHGFGHAARTAALLVELRRRRPSLEIDLVTTVPRWFFEQSGLGDLTIHDERTDVGLVQKTALREDLEESVAALEDFDPFAPTRLERWAERLHATDCRLVVCDIAPAGLLAARRAGLPSVLLENFTWSWIYRGYEHPGLLAWADRLEPVFEGADLRLQTQPVCKAAADAAPRKAIQVGPIARQPSRSRDATRRLLAGICGLDDESTAGLVDGEMVLVTMGGVPWDWSRRDWSAMDRVPLDRARWLLVAGASDRPAVHLGRLGGVLLLPHRAPIEHPDLVAAADAVLGKLGYSTVAEVATNGVRFGYVPRPSFRESDRLEAWVREHLAARAVAPDVMEARSDGLGDDAWIAAALALLDLPRRPPVAAGTSDAADAVLGLLPSGD